MSEFELELLLSIKSLVTQFGMIQYDISRIKGVLGDSSMGLNEIAVQLRAQNQLWTQFLLEGKE